MIISEEELKQKFDPYQDKLSLKEIPIEIKITSNSTNIYFKESRNSYFIMFNESGQDFELIHELGHILLTKETSFLIFSNLPISKEIDNYIFKIIDYLINPFINSKISRINETYPMYRTFFENFINKRYCFKSTAEEIAFNICVSLEHLFNLKPYDHSIELMKYLRVHKESLSQKSSFSEEKYDNLLPQLHKFREIKYSKDAGKNFRDFNNKNRKCSFGSEVF